MGLEPIFFYIRLLGMNHQLTHNKIESIIAPGVESLGYELLGCEIITHSKSVILRAYIDHPNGIGLEDCTKVSRQINLIPELETAFPSSYHLEVSSPGLDRPLFKFEHYARYVGEKVKLKLRMPINQQQNFTGVLIQADSENIILELSPENQVEIAFSNIEKARLVPVFDF